MRRPSVLSRRNPTRNKKDFGHLLVVAGSAPMLGAAALCSLAAMRSGAGLVTAAVPQALNSTLQKKVAAVVMTWPLPQTSRGTFSFRAFSFIKENFSKYDSMALGPGLGREAGTRHLIKKLMEHYPGPMVVDADGLNAIVETQNFASLRQAEGPRILTPHPGEMARLTKKSVQEIEGNRKEVALNFARQNNCMLVLKGHRTIVAAPAGRLYINTTGNVGMATAGSGDVLTGMMAAFLAQGMNTFEAARWAVYYHGKAGDWAARKKGKVSLMATDLIEAIPMVLK